MPPLETASQDFTTIENPMDTETPSAPINQDLTTDRPAPTAVESSSPSPVLHLEPLPEKSPALPPAGPSGISPAHVHEPEWVEKAASHGRTLYEHEIAKKIERSLPPSSPLSHTSASVPTSTPAQHQWIDMLSADYGHPVESTQLTFSWIFTDALYERYGFLDLSDTVNIPFPEKDWNFITHTIGHPSSTEKTNALHRAISLFLSNMLSKIAPPSFIWDIGELCDIPLTEASQDSPFRVFPITIEGCHHYLLSSVEGWFYGTMGPQILRSCYCAAMLLLAGNYDSQTCSIPFSLRSSLYHASSWFSNCHFPGATPLQAG